MVWKTITTPDAGTVDLIGGDDFNKISNLFNGNPAIDIVTFDSDIRFATNRLQVLNPTKTFRYIFASSAIVANRTITIPLLTSNQVMTFNTFPATLTGKTMDAAANTFTNLVLSPSLKKTGLLLCVSATETGLGILDGHTKLGTPTVLVDTSGSYWRFDSTTTINTIRGVTMPANFIRRNFNPLLRVGFQEPDATTYRPRIGFTNQTTLSTAAVPLAAANIGALMYHDGAATANWQLAIANGTTLATADTGFAIDNIFHTYEMRMSDTLATVYIRRDAGTETGYTASVPASTDDIRPQMGGVNSAAVQRFTNISFVELYSDK